MSLVDKVRTQIRTSTAQITEAAQKIAASFTSSEDSAEEPAERVPTPTAKSMREQTGRISALAAKLTKI